MDPQQLELPEELHSDRLIIRKYQSSDGAALFALLERNNNRKALMPNVEEVATIKNRDAAELKIRRHAAEWITRKRFVMGVWLKIKDLYVGEIWIEPNQWQVPSFELGWFLDTGYWGMGYATEAAKRAMEFIFEDLKAHKIVVITRDYNERSYLLAERLGFVKEGHFREGRIEEGKRFGLLYYGMLREEYR